MKRAKHNAPRRNRPLGGVLVLLSSAWALMFALRSDSRTAAAAGGRALRQGVIASIDIDPLGTDRAEFSAVNPVTNRIYVSDSDGDQLSVIRGSDHTVINTINVGLDPAGVAVNPNTNRIYVANSSANTVTVIDGSNDSVITNINVGANPQRVAVNPATNRIFVTNLSGSSVSVIDGSNNMVVTTIPLANANPFGIAANPATNRIYVAHDLFPGVVTVIDGSNNMVLTTITNLQDGTRQVAVNPVTNRVYVTSDFNDTVHVIDGNTNTPLTIIGGANETDGIAVNPNTNRIYVADCSEPAVQVIDGNLNQFISAPPVGTDPENVSVNETTGLVYVNQGFSNASLSVLSDTAAGGTIDVSTDRVLHGGGPGGSRWELSNRGGTSNGLPSGGSGGTGAGLDIDDADLDRSSLTTRQNQSDAYDNAAIIFVNNQVFALPNNMGNLANGVFTAGPVMMSGLNTTMQYSPARNSATLRTLATFQNPSGNPITVTVHWVNNNGSNGSTGIRGTSDGDLNFTTADRWIVTSDSSDGDPVNTYALFGPGAPVSMPVSVSTTVFSDSGVEGVLAEYQVMVPAGSTRSLLFFNQLNQTRADALAAAPPMFDMNPVQGSDLLSGMSSQQLNEVVNWRFESIFQNTYPAGLNMIGLPCNGAGTGADIFGMNTPFASWDVANQSYVVGSNQTVTRGTGYWARFAAPQPVMLTGCDDRSLLQWPLRRGWNQVGNGFVNDLPWNLANINVTFDNQTMTLQNLEQSGGANAQVVADFGWFFDNAINAYRPVADPSRLNLFPPDLGVPMTSLPRGGSMFLFCNRDGVTVQTDASNGSLSRTLRSASITSQQTSRVGPGDWTTAIEVRGGETVDRAVFGYDTDLRQTAIRLQKPPMAPDRESVEVAFGTTADAGNSVPSGLRYASDVRRALTDRSVFNLEVRTSLNDENMQIHWPSLGTLPRPYRLTLVDESTGARRAMRTTSGYTFLSNPEGETVRRFRIEVSRDGSGALRIQDMRLQTAGRGYHVLFSLSEEADVSGRLISPSGKVITSLPQARGRTGLNSMLFEARDGSGRLAARGVYLFELSARNEEGEQVRAVRSVNVK